MSDKPRSSPPDIPNFRHVGYLGGGGFADVFLYDQLRPTRPVAIKVLRTVARDRAAQAAFDAEADLMARVSAHPYIVTIYEADIAPDGRPFLVMEYYPRPHFGVRARQGPLAVHEVLQVGVRLASAVEAAHRAGILHRDIKPANVLVSAYGRPGLTDFGIAGATDDAHGGESQGLSFAYAAPEVVRDVSPGDERSDIYSLAATLYTLLAGRSPFESPGGDNSIRALAQRVLTAPLPPIERQAVGASFELLLAQSLARDPRQRPRSAADFGRSLQRIERELGHTPTEFELADAGTEQRDPGSVLVADDEDGTRLSKVQVVRQAPVVEPIQADPSVISGVPGSVPRSVERREPRKRVPAPGAPDEPDTTPAARQKADLVPSPTPSGRKTGRRGQRVRWLTGGAVLLLVTIAGVAIALSGGGAGGPTTTSTLTVDENALGLPDTPPVPTNVTVTVSGTSASVSWKLGEGANEDDTYMVVRTDRDGGAPVEATSPPVQIAVEAGSVPCFEVSAKRLSRVSIESARGCAAG